MAPARGLSLVRAERNRGKALKRTAIHHRRPIGLPTQQNANGGSYYPGQAYDAAKRHTVVGYRLQGRSLGSIARELQISKTGVRYIVSQFMLHGTAEPLPRGNIGEYNHQCKIKKPEMMFIIAYIAHKPNAYNYEIAEAMHDHLGISISPGQMCETLSSLGLNRKKRIKCAIEKFTYANLLYLHKFNIYRQNFLDARRVVIVDEVMLHETDISRLYGYAFQRFIQPDKKPPGNLPGVMFLVAAGYDRVLPITLPVPQPNKVTAWLFEWWCLWMLAPSLQPGTTVVLDNARVHRRGVLQHIFHAYGCDVLFLPAYSPEYSWVEYIFSYLHLMVARDVRAARADMVGTVLEVLHNMPAQHVQNLCRHCGWVW